MLEDAGSTKGGVFSSLRGLSGALKRVQSVSYISDLLLYMFADSFTEVQEGSRDRLSRNERACKIRCTMTTLLYSCIESNSRTLARL